MKYEYRHTEIYKGFRIDCRAHSSKELIEKVSARKEKIDHQAIDHGIRLHDFINLYLKTYKENTVSASWYKDLCYLGKKITDGIGNKPIGKIRPLEVQTFLNACNGYSYSTIKKIYDLTNQVFRHATINGATSYTFNLTVPAGKPTQKAGRSLTDQEQHDLLKSISGHRGELFILIMYYCGLRPSEVSALTWGDIDLNNNIVHITKAAKPDGTIGPTKSAAGVRDIPLPSILSTRLKKHARAKSEPICGQRNGLHTKSSIRKLWSSILTTIESQTGQRPTYRMYDIRHTYCTNLERKGVPINIASRLMGHSDISITSRIYTHATDASLEIARSLIDR